MNSIINIVVVVLVSTNIAIDGAVGPVCRPNSCKWIRCRGTVESIRDRCENLIRGVIIEKGGLCQCCPVCLKPLHEDQNCSLTIRLQLPVRSKCSEGLECDPKLKRCVRKRNETEVIAQNVTEVSTEVSTEISTEVVTEVVTEAENKTVSEQQIQSNP